VGIATQVWRGVRYDGPSGCAHELLLQAGRPSAPNADQGALDAAEAFAEGSLDHLQAWFVRWRLPSLCAEEHTETLVGRCEERVDLDGPGFRRVRLWRSVSGGWLTLSPAPFGDAEQVTAYLLRDAGSDGDLTDSS
jgi:hypothetical protein